MIMHPVFPSLAKRPACPAVRGQERLFKEIIRKIPINPPFPKGET